MIPVSFPEILFRDYLGRYPGFPSVMEKIYSLKEDWPSRCYVPDYIASPYFEKAYGPFADSLDSLVLDFLSTWQLEKLVVECGSTVPPPVDGALDTRAFTRLPSRCPFYSLPPGETLGAGGRKIPLHGFFAMNDADDEQEAGDLLFLLAGEKEGKVALKAWDLPLGGSIDAALADLEGGDEASPTALTRRFLPFVHRSLGLADCPVQNPLDPGEGGRLTFPLSATVVPLLFPD